MVLIMLLFPEMRFDVSINCVPAGSVRGLHPLSVFILYVTRSIIVYL